MHIFIKLLKLHYKEKKEFWYPIQQKIPLIEKLVEKHFHPGSRMCISYKRNIHSLPSIIFKFIFTEHKILVTSTHKELDYMSQSESVIIG